MQSPFYKQNKIVKVDISLKQLLDVDTTNELYYRRTDNIFPNQVLTSYTNQFRRDAFRFKYLTDLIQAGTGVTITNNDGVLTISSTGGGGATTLASLTDVNLTSPTVGDVLLYDGSFWYNTPLTGGGDMLKSIYDIDNDGVVDKAETVQIIVRNSTGATLTKGQVVYLSGATGNRPNAVLSDATTEATSSKTIGLVSANIANNADGYVTISGTMHDLDLSMFSAGDRLWLDTTPGGMVATTPPVEPNHAVFIGTVARAHPTQGRIVLAIQNGYELTELHGVLVPSPSNNDVLRYNSTTGLWEDDSIVTILGYTPANINSPAFTGTPTAPTPSSGDNDTSIATTAFVTSAIQQSLSFVGYFGAGTDGNATISGPVTLTKDMFYNDLTIAAGGQLNMAGYRIFVKGNLDLTNAGTQGIYNNGFPGGNNVASASGAQNIGGTTGRGGFGSTVYGWFVGGTAAGKHKGGFGGGGGTAGANGGNAPAVSVLLATEGFLGGQGGASGVGGNSASGATGGLGNTGQVTGITVAGYTTHTPQTFIVNPSVEHTLFSRIRQDTSLTGLVSFTTTTYIYYGAGHGAGGGGGAANSTVAGMGGGAGGGGGGTVVIFARNIIVGPSTDAQAISAKGGNGGTGGTQSTFNGTGGGGAGGGGGGFVYLVAGNISGTTGITFVSANGGIGGNGGDGRGAGNFGGQGGSGGYGGKITVINLSTGNLIVTDSTATAASAAALPIGTAGTAGTAGATCTFSS